MDGEEVDTTTTTTTTTSIQDSPTSPTSTSPGEAREVGSSSSLSYASVESAPESSPASPASLLLSSSPSNQNTTASYSPSAAESNANVITSTSTGESIKPNMSIMDNNASENDTGIVTENSNNKKNKTKSPRSPIRNILKLRRGGSKDKDIAGSNGNSGSGSKRGLGGLRRQLSLSPKDKEQSKGDKSNNGNYSNNNKNGNSNKSSGDNEEKKNIVEELGSPTYLPNSLRMSGSPTSDSDSPLASSIKELKKMNVKNKQQLQQQQQQNAKKGSLSLPSKATSSQLLSNVDFEQMSNSSEESGEDDGDNDGFGESSEDDDNSHDEDNSSHDDVELNTAGTAAAADSPANSAGPDGSPSPGQDLDKILDDSLDGSQNESFCSFSSCESLESLNNLLNNATYPNPTLGKEKEEVKAEPAITSTTAAAALTSPISTVIATEVLTAAAVATSPTNDKKNNSGKHSNNNSSNSNSGNVQFNSQEEKKEEMAMKKLIVQEETIKDETDVFCFDQPEQNESENQNELDEAINNSNQMKIQFGENAFPTAETDANSDSNANTNARATTTNDDKPKTVSPQPVRSILKRSSISSISPTATETTSNLSSSLLSTPPRPSVKRAVSFSDENGGKLSSHVEIAVSPSKLVRRVRRTTGKIEDAGSVSATAWAFPSFFGLGNIKGTDKSNDDDQQQQQEESNRLLVLLMDPPSKQYELTSILFPYFSMLPGKEDKAVQLRELIPLIPKAASHEPLKNQIYTGFTRPSTGVEMLNTLTVSDYAIKKDEVLLAIPEGYSAKDCTKFAKPILEDSRLVRLLKKLKKAQKKQDKMKSRGGDLYKTKEMRKIDQRRPRGGWCSGFLSGSFIFIVLLIAMAIYKMKLEQRRQQILEAQPCFGNVLCRMRKFEKKIKESNNSGQMLLARIFEDI